MNHLRMVIYLNWCPIFPLLGYNKAHINSHCFLAWSFENLWNKCFLLFFLITLWNKNICCQLNLLIFNFFDERFEIPLEFLFNCFFSFSIFIFGLLELHTSDLGPLILEFIFQELSWINIKHYDFFWSEFKISINLLKFWHFVYGFLLHFLFLITSESHKSFNKGPPGLSILILTIIYHKLIFQYAICYLFNLVFNIADNCFKLEKVLFPLYLLLEVFDLFAL